MDFHVCTHRKSTRSHFVKAHLEVAMEDGIFGTGLESRSPAGRIWQLSR